MTHDRWTALTTQTEIAHWHDTMADDYSEFEDELQQDQSQPDDDEESDDLDCALSEEIAALKAEARQLLRRRIELMRLRDKRLR